MLKQKIVQLIKDIDLSNYINIYEIYKLRRGPRYSNGIAKTKIGNISYVDSATFIGGMKEIFSQELLKVKRFSNEKFTVIDCGANIGLASIYFTKKYNAKVYAYEADPLIAKCLQKNIKNLNLDSNITSFNKAVWIDDKGVDFETEGGYSGRINNYPKENVKTIKVPSISLSEIITQFDHIDFLKIDIEGAENQVLYDCQDMLKNVDNIFLEYHSSFDQPQKLGDILNLLKNEGFRYQLKEAFTSNNPFMKVEKLAGMDLQLNIYAYR